jgi:glycosyltransferase involved in cell wall biosynthesis
MKVSIITVTYNARRFIEGAIHSVLSQTYPDIEYIIVDGASTDGTMGIVDHYRDRIARIVSEPDHGVFDAMNKAIALSTGEVLFFLGADDWLFDQDVIKDVVRAFEVKGADIVHGMVRYVNVPVSYQGTILGEYKGNHPMPTGYHIIRYLLCHQACFCKKHLFDRYGIFDISYKIHSDFNWLLKAISSGARMEYIDRDVVCFNVTGISSNLFGAFLEHSRSIFKWYGFRGIVCHVFWRSVNVLLFISGKFKRSTA